MYFFLRSLKEFCSLESERSKQNIKKLRFGCYFVGSWSSHLKSRNGLVDKGCGGDEKCTEVFFSLVYMQSHLLKLNSYELAQKTSEGSGHLASKCEIQSERKSDSQLQASACVSHLVTCILSITLITPLPSPVSFLCGGLN